MLLRSLVPSKSGSQAIFLLLQVKSSALVMRLTYLGDVDTRPEQFQVFPHLGWLVLGVEDGQLCEHAHVGPLQAEGCLHQSNELIKVALLLVVVDELLELVSMNHDV